MKQLLPAHRLTLLLMAAGALLIGLFSLSLGRYPIPLKELFVILGHKLTLLPNIAPVQAEIVLFQVRFPRIAAALLIGGALSLAGTTYQGLFKNPMISPDILGAAAGAGFGAALAILFSWNMAGIQVSAFTFGLLAVMITYFISAAINKGTHTILILVLTGVLVSTLFTSLISIIKFTADPFNKLPAITFWLMGGLANISMHDLRLLSIPLILGAVPLLLLRWKLNVLCFGEEEARALGLNVKRIRPLIILCATLLTAASVAVSGMIGFVGLVIPHMARLLIGPNHRTLLPASFFLGGAFLVIVDDAARCIFPVEIPLGILTSLVGAPFFLFLLMKGRKSWL
ncbi:MAG: Fe3+-siderophore ABC transporter permease [Elusimicrobia bacterium RIFOXYB2_FULL_49_7]|nr:MAG: Fe3+-siderophore ABC transporter permease [Elusimicrobia bacterium RIFOXYB2_FULL_49_7]